MAHILAIDETIPKRVRDTLKEKRDSLAANIPKLSKTEMDTMLLNAMMGGGGGGRGRGFF